MASDVRRKAAAIIVQLIDGWWSEFVESKTGLTVHVEAVGVAPKVDVATRAELLRLKETFERVAAAVDEPKPEGWSEGDPMVGVCNCNECVDKKARAAMEAGRLMDPRVCERCHNTGFETVPMDAFNPSGRRPCNHTKETT